MRKVFFSLALLLYFIFLVETITGYWIWKPREISALFLNILDRGTAFFLHVNVLPLILVVLFLIHSYWGIYRKIKNTKLRYSFLTFNVLILILVIYMHFI